MPKKETMDITVIIPAWNEEKHIEQALRAIQNQNFKGSKEIIVVDNNSTDRTIEIVERLQHEIPLTLIRQTIQGTNATRQAGYEKAKGGILAYCDADCIPPESWLADIFLYMKNKERAAVSGPYNFSHKKDLGWFDRQYAKLFASLTKRTFLGKKIAIMIGGNFAVKREALDAIGGFPDIAFWGDDTCLALELAHHYGPVWFTTNLVMKSSPRRFQGKGRFSALKTPFVGLWTGLKYIWAFLKIWVPFKPSKLRPRAKTHLR